ncbi:S9 family peptidase [Caulobacter vibrioides]|uniref:S9 family peptidase n=1 Tax=Caulobacter vibrioides TaxID=155892 RepID=A0A290MQQ6_CAUVI|nr:S9 family peptidase [Caulobacter vibrioides]ATC32160.1 S9 family peptidase [Caulobacter vibrioides]
MTRSQASLSACLASSILLALAVTPAAVSAPASGASAARSATYSASQFFETIDYRLAGGSGLAFSHDGRFVLTTSDRSGVYNAYAVPVQGGEPIALTTSTTNTTQALSWFPKDGRILVISDKGGDERARLYVRELDGSLRDLTPEGRITSDLLGWSGDRSKIWIASTAPDRRAPDIFAVDPATYESRLLFQNPGMLIEAISPDGRWVALRRQSGSADSDVYLADLSGGGKPRLITPHVGMVRHQVYDFTPDSSALIFGSDAQGEFGWTYRYNLASGAVAEDLKGDWDVTAAHFSPSGRYRVSAFNADARTEMSVTDVKTGAPITLKDIPIGDIGAVRFRADEKQVAFTVSSSTSPADVFVADLKSGKTRRLTRALNPAMKESDLVEAVVIRYQGEGGVTIPANLYRPKGATASAPAPGVVMAHGGPGGQARRDYSAIIQHLVNHGYAVLAVNNRGSSGYGKTFFRMDNRAHGEADLRDVIAGGQWLRDQDWVADNKVAVMGGSYGGYLALAALTFHPQSFEAAIDIFGVTNWTRTLNEAARLPESRRTALYDEMGDPATDAERHRRISPLFHASNIVKPLLVMQGANDPRVLKIESDELVAAVKANGTPVEYVVFPDEGHGFRRRENRIKAQEAYLRFLDRYVRSPSAPKR